MALAAEVLPRTFGRYTLLEHLGEGGMAEVLLARQEGIEGTHRLVAIKRILPALLRDEDFVEMFLDEVRIVFGLHHPNIGHILDVGRAEGTFFLAMEYIQGRDLAQVCRRLGEVGRKVPAEVAVETGRQVCAALDHAHARTDKTGRPLNIVHRDITADNIIITFDGATKVVDFGIAVAENRLSRTRAGLLKGKPPYMAPELVMGLPFDGRADIFSLGVVLYRLITGIHPFQGSSPERIFNRIIDDTPPPPMAVREGCPRALSDIVQRCLEKDPDERYESAMRLSDALDEMAVELGGLPAPRTMGRWLAELFPSAAAARDRTLADPSDSRAAIDASYLSVSAALEGAEGEADDLERSEIHTHPAIDPAHLRRRKPGPSSDAARPRGSHHLPESGEVEDHDDECDPDDRTIIDTAILDQEDSREVGAVRSMENALAWAFEESDPREPAGAASPDPPVSEPGAASLDPPVTEPGAASLDPPVTEPGAKWPDPPVTEPGPALGPSREDRDPRDVWSPRQHWDHLPPRLRSPPVVAATCAALALLLLFAVLGVHSCV